VIVVVNCAGESRATIVDSEDGDADAATGRDIFYRLIALCKLLYVYTASFFRLHALTRDFSSNGDFFAVQAADVDRVEF
jgi:hypothetical protein